MFLAAISIQNLASMFQAMYDGIGLAQTDASDLAPYLADTEKARLLQSDGTYVRAHRTHATGGSRNGTRFGVQRYLMGLSEEQEGAAGNHAAAHFLKARNSPMIEILSKSWEPMHIP